MRYMEAEPVVARLVMTPISTDNRLASSRPGGRYEQRRYLMHLPAMTTISLQDRAGRPHNTMGHSKARSGGSYMAPPHGQLYDRRASAIIPQAPLRHIHGSLLANSYGGIGWALVGSASVVARSCIGFGLSYISRSKRLQ